jgi:hypothetical protein
VSRRARWAVGYLAGAAVVAAGLWDRDTLAVVLVGAAVCSVAGWRLVAAGGKVRTIVVLSVIARVFVLPIGPSLSDDGYRYLWDGYAQSAGMSPYAAAPADAPFLAPAELLARMNSPQFYSVYPPVSQLAFAASVAGTGDDWRVGWYRWKALCLGAELLSLALVYRLGSRGGVALYGLHPLVWIEAVGQAHSEVLLVPALLGAVWLLRHSRLHLWAGAAIAAAGLIKLYPFVLLPLFAQTRKAWLAAALTALLVSSPYLSLETVRNGWESVRLFGAYFEFNGGVYIPFKAWLWDHAPALGPHAARLLQLIFVLLLPLALWHYRRRPVDGAIAILVGYFALSATVHPWYALGVLALVSAQGRLCAPVAVSVAAWGLLSLSTYSRYVWGEEAYLISVALTWGGALIAWASCHAWQRLRPTRRSDRVRVESAR